MSNMVVRTNVMAINSHRNLGLVGNQQARASGRLSSGFRINSASDDAAGLAISTGMRAQIRGMNQASRNAQDGVSMIRTAEGFLQTLTEMITRQRDLAVQAANDTYSSEQRDIIASEIEEIRLEGNRILRHATFNTLQLFVTDGENVAVMAGAFTLHVGADSGHAIGINVSEDLAAVTAAFHEDHFTSAAVSAHNQGDWNRLIDGLNDFLEDVTTMQAALGAQMNKLEFTVQNLDVAAENMSAAESRIRDADMAQEMMRLTQANILQQAATAMLAQANQAPQSILQLLG